MIKDYRYEIKFVLDDYKIAEVMEWLYTKTTAVNKYDNRLVNSIYFDDSSFSAVRANLAGISQRCKYRLRWYGHEAQSQPRFEVKIRNGRVGRKSAFQLRFTGVNLCKPDYTEITSKCIKELAKENVFFDDYLLPALHVSYDREYFETHEGIRITVDRDIMFMDTHAPNNCITDFSYRYPLKIVEIKFTENMYALVTNLIRPLHATPRRHSKYMVGLAALGYAVYI